MNNQKTFLIAGSIILGVIALSLVFMAGRMSGGFERNGNYEFSRTMMGNGEGRGGNRDGRGMDKELSFIDESLLSAEQKTQLTAIKDKYKTQMQDLMQSMKSKTGTGSADLMQKIEDLWTAKMGELRVFVSQDKLSDFDAFVSNGKPQMGKMGRGTRGAW